MNINEKTKKVPWLLCICLGFVFLSGCDTNSGLAEAQKYVKQSEDYYRAAVSAYEKLLSQKNASDKIRFELGKLYYSHGDFQNAIEQFRSCLSADRNTGFAQAKKLLAVSYYRLGSFSDALEIFGKNGALDDEGRYYQGLTCERLNLYDTALDAYRKIKSAQFAAAAQARISAIEKQINPQKIVIPAPAAENYPQAGALILSCDERVEVTAQDTQITGLHYIIKILNERGKQDFSEAHIDYDSTYEKVELEYARTIKPDGQVADVGQRHIRDVSKYLNFPLYSNVRVYIISFPEISEGAVIEYKLKVYRNQLINKKDFVLAYPLQASEPVISASFSLELPRERALGTKTLNEEYNIFGANLKPSLEKANSRLIYRWQFRDIPQIIPESNMPAIPQVNPTLLISTFNSWQEIYNWWRKLAEDKLKADTAIKEKVKELTVKLDSEEEKARAIYNFCSQKIRYVAVEYGQAGYEPHKAEDIFKNKYGDCKDQAVLLVTMLKEAGLSAWLVLIPTKDQYNLNPDFPSVIFDHAIACVSLKNEVIFLDPTAETCSFGDLPADDQDRRVLVFKDDNYVIETTPLYPAGHNLIRQQIDIKINADESISSKKSIFSYGLYDQAQRYWLLYTPPKLVEEALKEKIQEVSIGAKLGKYTIENLNDLNKPVALNYEFTGREYFTNAGNLRIIPQLAGVDASLVAKEKRQFPVDFNILDSKETLLRLELPQSISVKYLPEDVNLDSRWLKFSAAYKHTGRAIEFSQKMELKVNLIPQGEYADFKNFFEGLAKKIKQRIVLEKKN